MCVAVIQQGSAAGAVIELESALQQLGTNYFHLIFSHTTNCILLFESCPPPPFIRILLRGGGRILSSTASQDCSPEPPGYTAVNQPCGSTVKHNTNVYHPFPLTSRFLNSLKRYDGWSGGHETSTENDKSI